MSHKHHLIIVVLVTLLASTALSFQPQTRVLVQRESLKVLAGDAFPRDLECEIHVGSEDRPYFRTNGKNARIQRATIDITPESTISVCRKHTEKESYCLFFFSQAADGELFSLFDLDMDGDWDMRVVPAHTKKISIFIDNKWLEVDRVDDHLSAKPKATEGDKNYEFNGIWTVVP